MKSLKLSSLLLALVIGVSARGSIRQKNPLSAWLRSNDVCFHDDGIGCFSTTAPFDNARGSVPESPAHIQVEFILFTRQTTNEPESITRAPSSISQSSFDGNKNTKIIIHGYRDSSGSQWINDMISAFLLMEDVNVIAVNWANGASNPNYFQSAANTRVVGALIGEFMKSLYATARVSYSSMHLIGHSLGSHIAGYAGARVQGTGRITGLDPAGPGFENQDVVVRLDPNDAQFVDVIHTNGDTVQRLGFGLQLAVGHVDFYPNGGQHQPGCPDMRINLFNLLNQNMEDLVSGVACSHMVAIYFFTESIKSPQRYNAYPCANKSDFDAGRCSTCDTGCAYMGNSANPEQTGTFYLSAE